ncbi:phospholipid-transporting ATPase ABCA3-like [Ixodes scapularis]
MGGSCLISTILTWYLSNIWPYNYSFPEKFWFFLHPIYWGCWPNVGVSENDDLGAIPEHPGLAEPAKERSSPYLVVYKLSKLIDPPYLKHYILHDATLKAYLNNITIILGRNGCGKSILLRMLTGLGYRLILTISSRCDRVALTELVEKYLPDVELFTEKRWDEHHTEQREASVSEEEVSSSSQEPTKEDRKHQTDPTVSEEKCSVASMMKYLTEGKETKAPAGLAVVQVEKERPGGLTFGPITFRVLPGEIFGVIGLAQAGRSLLLRIIAGVETIDKGNVFINGVDARRRPLNVSLSFQFSGSTERGVLVFFLFFLMH